MGTAPSNFTQQLAAEESELVQQIAKDPYNFEFLGLTGKVAERDLEQALMDRIIDTLRELGPGFAFVGRQVHFDVGGDGRLPREVHADTVGILICADKNDHRVRYSLGRAVSPMAVASYTYDSLPAREQAGLPNAEKLTAALDRPSDETTPPALMNRP